ncbi:type IV toxin-antitoxin system AbiEi family antitoxin domain-containing protein [Streptomyces alkaliphilus]|uniref:type IV toxin-antitoxin system AbiEi family antitoxin domain-containing protein n=1 Tax=Streptomyces alkaliphilus TaxID=1472722 RepID=UPI0015670FF4
MDRTEQVIILSGVAADQWGLVTAAQAKKLGLNAVQLKRLTGVGLLENVGRGVYAMPAAGQPRHLETKVAWLRLQPEVFAWERAPGDPDSGVVSHASACRLHDLGDIPASGVEISVPRRRTTVEPFVRLRTARLDTADITVIDGLPVTTVERTVVDLLKAKADGGHVGGVIADAVRRDLVNIDKLAERVQPFVRRYGLPSSTTGHELVDHLVEQAGRHLRFRQWAGPVQVHQAVAIGPPEAGDDAESPALHGATDAVAARIIEVGFRELAAAQRAGRDATAKTVTRAAVNEAIHRAVRQLRDSPEWVDFLAEISVSTDSVPPHR